MNFSFHFLSMAYTVVSSASIQWTPPSAPSNSGQSTFANQASYNAQNVGSIDIPSGTSPSTDFDIPFGSVGRARVLIVKSMMTSDVNVSLNGSPTPTFTLPPGAKFSFEAPMDPTTGTHPITSATITALVAPTNVESCQFFVFGD